MKRLHIILLGVALLAAGFWAYRSWRGTQSGPVTITLRLGYSSPMSRQYFSQMVLYATRYQSSPESPDSQSIDIKDPAPTISEPGRKVWTLDPATFAGYKLELRDPIGILAPWKRQVLHTDFGALLQQPGRHVDLTIGGNTARVSFRKSDQKLVEAADWRHTLVSVTARLMAADPAAAGTPWRLVQHTLLRQDCTCQFALISPGDYRVELLDSAGKVMLSGPLHVPGDSDQPQQLEAEVERP